MKKKLQKFQSKILNYPDNSDAVEISARIVKKGGLIIFPTMGAYGLGASITNKESLKKIFEIKKRPLSKPVLILIKDLYELQTYCRNIPRQAIVLMEKIWPGDITFVLEASSNIPEILTGNTGKIGVRIPSHPFTVELLKNLESPLTGTSANISGEKEACEPEKINYDIISKTDLFINAGFTGKKKPSTIVQADNNGIKILRKGRINEKQIKKFLF